jgi:hypothetical protein
MTGNKKQKANVTGANAVINAFALTLYAGHL